MALQGYNQHSGSRRSIPRGRWAGCGIFLPCFAVRPNCGQSAGRGTVATAESCSASSNEARRSILSAMRIVAKFLIVGVFAVVATAWNPAQTPVATAQAQAPAQDAPPVQAPGGQPTFRVSVDLVTTDVIVRDQRNDQFVADLKPEEFEIYEDGVKKQLVSILLKLGGRG